MASLLSTELKIVQSENLQLASSSDLDNSLESAVDGDASTKWHSGYSNYPWIQVELAEATWVGRVVITARTDHDPTVVYRFNFLEVRVGDQDVAGETEEEAKLCKNRLCYRTGEDIDPVTTVDCITPLRGKFVTVQKYAHSLFDVTIGEEAVNNHYLEISEIALYVFYCSMPEGRCFDENTDACAIQQDGCE